VISDEAHRTQAGKLARNMRLALPNAAFIGFTGTPLFKHDQLTKRIFGDYVSRYDFKRSEEDGATVKLVYENRGEKLGLARLDLNEKIARRRCGRSGPRPDGASWRSCSARTTRSSPPTSGWTENRHRLRRALQHALGSGQGHAGVHRQDHLRPHADADRAEVGCQGSPLRGRRGQAGRDRRGGRRTRQQLHAQRDRLLAKATWLDETIIEIIISEAQNEVADFKKWGFDIIPHRAA
jgi:type I restriction enzyme R subunit